MPKYSQNIREIRNFAKQNLFCNNFAMFREFCKENHFSSFSHNFPKTAMARRKVCFRTHFSHCPGQNRIFPIIFSCRWVIIFQAEHFVTLYLLAQHSRLYYTVYSTCFIVQQHIKKLTNFQSYLFLELSAIFYRVLRTILLSSEENEALLLLLKNNFCTFSIRPLQPSFISFVLCCIAHTHTL